jgi:anti-anti-sigma factor
MNTNIDYKRGVLFIRINGVLVGNKIEKFESEVIPIILGLGSRYVTINVYELELIDSRGINSIIKLSNIVSRYDGKLAICEINDSIKENFKNSDVFDYCFKTKNELTSLGVFSI